MTEVARFFDATSYGEGDQAEVTARMVRDGVVYGAANQLAVASGGTGFASINTGEGFVQGFWYKNTAPKTLPITANVSGTLRIDLVVLRLDRTGNTLLAVIKDGVVGSGTPALTQFVGGTWELPLAQISTISGVSTYTDMRVIQSPVYNPMNTAQDLVVGGAGGVPARMPVGAPSRVFGVNSSGVLGYYPVTTDMVTDGTLVNGDLAAQTLRGGVDVAASRFVPGSINTQDIQDRGIAGADIAVGAITNVEIADGTITNNEIAPNTIHPNRLTSWSGGTYGNYVLYDIPGGGGISVAQVQDSLCAPASINGNKLVANSVTNNEITDGTVRVYELAANAASVRSPWATGGTNPAGTGQVVFDNAPILPMAVAGDVDIYASLTFSDLTAGAAIVYLMVAIYGVTGWTTIASGAAPSTAGRYNLSGHMRVISCPAGSWQIGISATNNAGYNIQYFADGRFLSAVGYYR